MTRDLQLALDAVRRLPDTDQDRIADVMMRLAGGRTEVIDIDPTHLPDVLEGLAEARRGEFVSEEEVERVFRLFDR